MRKHYWLDLTTTDFAGLDPEKTIAILPVAAVEQHGPHLSVATDTAIAQGMLDEVVRQIPDDLSVLILPIQTIGKSNEHIRSPGTLTFSAETALRAWVEIGESVNRAGLRKMIIANSHGGNVDLISIVARELRVRQQMLVVTCSWGRFGSPRGTYAELENVVGIHGGDSETSLMLHFRPDLVRMENAKNFAPSTIGMMNEFAYLRPTGNQAFGWIAQDLTPDGTAGDASVATAEKGRVTAVHRAAEFLRLVRDVTNFSLARLA